MRRKIRYEYLDDESAPLASMRPARYAPENEWSEMPDVTA